MEPSILLAAFGLGLALGSSPGPVQLLLFSEASRGGAGRGLRAMAGANGTFGLMLLLLAVGVSSLQAGAVFLHVVEVVGGAFLVFLAVDAILEPRRPPRERTRRAALRPSTRGVLAVLLNPGVYVFLATTGTAIVARANEVGGRSFAVVTTFALLIGVSLMDSAMVLIGTGAHRVNPRFLRVLGDVLAIAMGALGVWLVVQGLRGP